eukprot:5212850-Ditylum_brightwellii.AAC.1
MRSPPKMTTTIFATAFLLSSFTSLGVTAYTTTTPAASSGPPKSYSPFGRKPKAGAPQNAYMDTISRVAPTTSSHENTPVTPAVPAASSTPVTSGPPKSYSPFGQKFKASAPQNAYMASISGNSPVANSEGTTQGTPAPPASPAAPVANGPPK